MYSALRHIPSIAWKGKPIQLTFFLTRRCNSKCPFCFYLKSSSGDVRKDVELSLDEIKKISRSLGNLLWVAFSGGEIYLRDDLVEISRVFHDTNRPAIMLFPTNGMLPGGIREKTLQILEGCRNSVIAVKLSVDGVGMRMMQCAIRRAALSGPWRRTACLNRFLRSIPISSLA